MVIDGMFALGLVAAGPHWARVFTSDEGVVQVGGLREGWLGNNPGLVWVWTLDRSQNPPSLPTGMCGSYAMDGNCTTPRWVGF